MKVKTYISNAYEKMWSYISQQRKAEFIAEALSDFNATCDVNNPIVQQISKSNWQDIPPGMKMKITFRFEDEDVLIP